MSDILCVTNRKLCKEDFFLRLRKIAEAWPAGIILREKDLPEQEYRKLAEQVMGICADHQVPCILHSFVRTAMDLQAQAIHVPLPILRTMSQEEKAGFSVLGASCHSVADAREAEALGCTYITAGHIFATDCKKGLPGRGIGFLKEVCESVSIPVYAIGGIDAGNIAQIRRSGAKGACLMSSLMTCGDAAGLLADMEETEYEIS